MSYRQQEMTNMQQNNIQQLIRVHIGHAIQLLHSAKWGKANILTTIKTLSALSRTTETIQVLMSKYEKLQPLSHRHSSVVWK